MKYIKKIKIFFKRSLNCLKFFYIRKKCSFNYLLNTKPGLQVKISGVDSYLKLTGNISNRNNVSFYISNGGKLEIGKGTFFNENCCVASRDRVSIGQGCLFGPNVCIFDHDHLFKDGIIEHSEFTTKAINIGSNVWCGANVIILKGSTIGSNVIIGAGAIIKGEIPDNSIVIQKREQIIKGWC